MAQVVGGGTTCGESALFLELAPLKLASVHAVAEVARACET